MNKRKNIRTYVLTYIGTGQTLYPLHNYVVRGDKKETKMLKKSKVRVLVNLKNTHTHVSLVLFISSIAKNRARQIESIISIRSDREIPTRGSTDNDGNEIY